MILTQKPNCCLLNGPFMSVDQDADSMVCRVGFTPTGAKFGYRPSTGQDGRVPASQACSPSAKVGPLRLGD